MHQRLNQWARKTILQPEQVAKEAIEEMLAHKTVIIPGMANKINYYLGKVIPTSLKQDIAIKIFQRMVTPV